MAYDPGAIDATLAAAVGDEPVLIAELRAEFLAGVRSAVDGLKAAKGAQQWATAALRLKSLAASFGAVRLMALAEEAVSRTAQDRTLLRRIERAVERL